MHLLLGTPMFWTTITGLIAALSITTFLGRVWAEAFPYKLQASARFYLSPIMGLAQLTLAASLLGRYLPLGNTIILPILVVCMLIYALTREQNRKQAFYQVLLVSVFGIICSLSILVPLFLESEINVYNDAFTYLSHSNWLQDHPFNFLISRENITPLETQVSLYQRANFRMGGSFVFALFQALFNMRWSYDAYPIVICASITASCLAIGFLLTKVLRPINRFTRLGLLALPALSVGSIVFAANYGFLPQLIGLGFGSAFLFINGWLFHWMISTKPNALAMIKSTCPGILLFVCTTFAYSEIIPFLVLSTLLSAMIVVFRFKIWKSMLIYGGMLAIASTIILNTEIVRAFKAILEQSNAIVGSIVPWDLTGYLGHALGVHGGAWDPSSQWIIPQFICFSGFFLGWCLLLSACFLLLIKGKRIKQAVNQAILLPTLMMVIILILAFVYYRYVVSLPFELEIKRSWSQFKLSEWAHPFFAALLLFSFATLSLRLRKFFNTAVITLFSICLLLTVHLSELRLDSFRPYDKSVNMEQYYLRVRNQINAVCPLSSPVYLFTRNLNMKIRQMFVLYLYDRELVSDWRDDGYIYTNLPREKWFGKITKGSCVIAPAFEELPLINKVVLGSLQIGLIDWAKGWINVSSVEGAYGLEKNQDGWWRWVEHKINFKLEPITIPQDMRKIRVSFGYATISEQTVKLEIKNQNNSKIIVLKSDGQALKKFQQEIDFPPQELKEISIEADGKAVRLGKADPRLASLYISNFTITPVKLETLTNAQE